MRAMTNKRRNGYRTIAVVGLKGGIGKSLISTLLACGFHRAKRKTLLVDADDQGSTRSISAKPAGRLARLKSWESDTSKMLTCIIAASATWTSVNSDMRA